MCVCVCAIIECCLAIQAQVCEQQFTHTHACPGAYKFKPMHIHSKRHTEAHAHAHARTHTHTHIHTHTMFLATRRRKKGDRAGQTSCHVKAQGLAPCHPITTRCAYMCVCVFVCVCVCARARMHAHLHMCVCVLSFMCACLNCKFMRSNVNASFGFIGINRVAKRALLVHPRLKAELSYRRRRVISTLD